MMHVSQRSSPATDSGLSTCREMPACVRRPCPLRQRCDTGRVQPCRTPAPRFSPLPPPSTACLGLGSGSWPHARAGFASVGRPPNCSGTTRPTRCGSGSGCGRLSASTSPPSVRWSAPSAMSSATTWTVSGSGFAIRPIRAASTSAPPRSITTRAAHRRSGYAGDTCRVGAGESTGRGRITAADLPGVGGLSDVAGIVNVSTSLYRLSTVWHTRHATIAPRERCSSPSMAHTTTSGGPWISMRTSSTASSNAGRIRRRPRRSPGSYSRA
jgi:hypothetical protein